MNVLFLTHRLPYAPNRGDRSRAYHMIKLLARHGRVHVVSLVHDAAEQAEVDTLRRLGVGVSTARVPRWTNLVRAVQALRSETPLTHALLDSPEIDAAIECAVRECRPDAVLAYCSGVARYALTPRLAGLPLILDLVDVDSAKWAAFAELSGAIRRWVFQREARTLAAFEARAARAAFATTVVNDREAQAMRRICPDADVHVIPIGVDVQGFAPTTPPSGEPHVIFTAVFNYAPNVDGAIWFAREVWPRVRAAHPSARLTLAGSSPARPVRQLAEADPSIRLTGTVADIRPYLWQSAVAIAPLVQARGVQTKVLEAVAAGLPCVITDAVRDGLPEEVLPACRTAGSPHEFAAAVAEWLSLTAEARRRLAARACVSGLAWPQRLARFPQLIAEATRRGAHGCTTMTSLVATRE